jgi:hypothetical protein
MATSWTKDTDQTTSYTDVNDASSSYTDVADQISQWAPFGGLLYLATEGGDILANEDESTYLVVSKGSEGITYTDVADQSTSWTKVSDA